MALGISKQVYMVDYLGSSSALDQCNLDIDPTGGSIECAGRVDSDLDVFQKPLSGSLTSQQ